MAKGNPVYLRAKVPERNLLYVGENFDLTFPKNILAMVDIDPGDRIYIAEESEKSFSLQKYRPTRD